MIAADGVETDLRSRVASQPHHPHSLVFHDGAVTRYHDVRIGPMAHALQYGTGCFEGIRAYWNPQREQLRLLKAREHFDRLRLSGRILKMDLAYSTEELVSLAAELCRRNEYRTDAYIRPLLFKSAETIGVRLQGLSDSLLIYTAPMGDYVAVDGGIRCMVSTWRRNADRRCPPGPRRPEATSTRPWPSRRRWRTDSTRRSC